MMIHFKQIINSGVTDELLEIREKRWRKKLPEEFKQFMKQNNGGIPDNRILVDNKWIIERLLCIVPKNSDPADRQIDIDVILTKYDEFMAFSENSLGADLIPFAQLNHESFLCLCYKTENPSVVVWEYIGSKVYSPKYTESYGSFHDFKENLR